MKRTLAGAAAAVALAAGGVAAAPPAQAAYDWGPIVTHSDFAGNGQLQVNYRIRQGYSVGFYVESVRICAASGGLAYQGIAGKGLWVRNEDGVTKFSTNNDSLDKGQCRAWDLEIGMPDASTLRSGWLFDDIFVPGSDVQQCARLTIHHNDWSSGGC
jgi:hypothetical protein